MNAFFRYGLVAACCAFVFTANLSYAQIANSLIIEKDKIYDPDKLSLDSIKFYEKNFNYDWNNYISISSNKKKLHEVEVFFRSTPPQEFRKLKPPLKQALGKMLYKLGTYYTHVEYKPDKAIKYLSSANNYLQMRTDKAWSYNNLAYAYEKKFTFTDDEIDQKQGLYFINKVMNLYPERKNKEIAFSYCIKGLFEMDAGKSKEAENDYKTAISIYEKIPNGKDSQYHRARTRLAAIMLENDDNDDALQILKDQKKYWQKEGNLALNPYAARNLLILCQAYLKLGRPEEAKKEVIAATQIYERIYGKNNEMLFEPYQVLADTYKILGEKDKAENYQILANTLDNS